MSQSVIRAEMNSTIPAFGEVDRDLQTAVKLFADHKWAFELYGGIVARLVEADLTREPRGQTRPAIKMFQFNRVVFELEPILMVETKLEQIFCNQNISFSRSIGGAR